MIQELVLATRNLDKGRELSALLKDLGVSIKTLVDFPDVPEVIEDGATCRDNAMKKAKEMARWTGLIAVADDTGLEVEALEGRPGIYAARYAGEGASYEDNCRKLLEEMNGVPQGKRGARFLTVAAIARPTGECHAAEGILEGAIAEQPTGNEGFGYDPVFFLPERGKTLAQLSSDEKNAISHRASAFQKVRGILQAYLREP